MDGLTLFGIAIALGMDAFAVSAAVAAALPVLTARRTFRLTWHFGFFQAMMTVIGWYAVSGFSTFLMEIDHWLAFGLLSFLGAKMIYDSRRPENRMEGYDPTRGWSLVALSVATSIDAFAVGVSFNLIGLSVWGRAALIGVAALIMTAIGTTVGRRGGVYLGRYAGYLGGVVLIAIGVRILVEHLTA